ncbi:sarcolemmal membrane-associated protein [Episyrphus balteatus]|uniref:sarcolemmal membrane-associated protein n=1 Tax=Episyrphus balteatus TaxID=286459 RepID=UPI002485D22D|nr:sarcolemmal membrane-associated protein [Episyrphus balteatus]
MVIASNEWMNYDDVKKQQSQIIETTTNALMMAAPSSLQPPPPSSSSSLSTAIGGIPPGTLINNNSTTTILLNDSSTSSDCDEPGCDTNNVARMVLVCQPDSHPFQTRTIYLTPNIECKVGRSIAKSKSSDNNAIFDCKVLSRTHAVLWYSNDGKFYVKDTKSSNGTYINDRKINSSEPVELNFGDVVKFGVEVMENSRKEVHGCIIASVKPYLPDGREAISITQDSPFRGDSRISFEELHRLNLYMQETSQREKLLKAKLQNIQNILDATRKNSTICWQSMIDEDRLLNRIDLLENKLQFLQKNSPVDQLKDEILKLQEEKFSYQNSAKEALSKVYQERMEAMQKLSKVERDYTCSENECSLLRDQIRYTKQNLQDVNTRLLSLEKEYSEYKDQVEKCQRETNEEQNNFDAAVAELAEKLKESETECEEYKKKIGELLLQRSEMLDEEDQKKKEKYTEENVVDAVVNANANATTNYVATVKTNDSSSTTTTLTDNIDAAAADENNDNESDKSSITTINHNDNDKKSTNLAANKSTIMKWLENSDLNSKEGSLDIMKAICNESDSSDDSENNDEIEKSSIITSNTTTTTSSTTATPTPTMSSEHITNKLQLVDKNLVQLEAELGNKHATIAGVENGIQQLENVSYQLLNYTVSLLRETYSEMCRQDTVANMPSSPFKNKSTTQPQLQMQETLINENDDDDEDDDDDADEDDKQYKRTDIVRQTQDIADYQNEVLRLQQLLESKESTNSDTINTLQSECDDLKVRISNLTKLVHNLNEQNEALEKEIAESKNNKSTKSTKSTIINEDNESTSPQQPPKINNADNDEETKSTKSNGEDSLLLSSCSISSTQQESLEKLIEEEKVAMNNAAIMNEEELILYKERFGQTQAENLKLKREIAELKLKFDDLAKAIFRKSLTYVTVFVALIVYFIFSYI